jgi:hypothetical protein
MFNLSFSFCIWFINLNGLLTLGPASPRSPGSPGLPCNNKLNLITVVSKFRLHRTSVHLYGLCSKSRLFLFEPLICRFPTCLNIYVSHLVSCFSVMFILAGRLFYRHPSCCGFNALCVPNYLWTFVKNLFSLYSEENSVVKMETAGYTASYPSTAIFLGVTVGSSALP